ncbi:hypothetical protein BRC74_05500 [Halobacteriales archaeon QH_7_68_42]|nr:MAG: hypothetical protein BRC74_05500 [Halobacteriales archaeon QH_7_68_42]
MPSALREAVRERLTLRSVAAFLVAVAILRVVVSSLAAASSALATVSVGVIVAPPFVSTQSATPPASTVR